LGHNDGIHIMKTFENYYCCVLTYSGLAYYLLFLYSFLILTISDIWYHL